jgi:hypothetical protein
MKFLIFINKNRLLLFSLLACIVSLTPHKAYSQSNVIVNWHKVTANALRNGVEEDSLYIFDIFYTKNASSVNECNLTISEVRNLSCRNNSSAYIEKGITRTLKDGLSCNVVKINNKFEQAVISYSTPNETTSLTVGYDGNKNATVEFEGSTFFTFNNSERIKINYIPLKSKKGYVDKSISCGKLNFRTLESN